MIIEPSYNISAATASHLKQDGLQEVEIVKHSNVGKSNLLKALTRQKEERKNAAHGKTQKQNNYRQKGEQEKANLRQSKYPHGEDPTNAAIHQPRRRRAPAGKVRALDAQGHERRRADQDREGSRRARRDRDAEAGADLRNLEGARREERADLQRGRPRGAARRLRLPAGAGLQLSSRPRRHLRVAVTDPQVRSPHGRHRVRPDSSAEGRRALLRADQSR